nr:alpha/beta fold hydrolase [Lysobacter sp. GX 14042]
MQVPVEAGDHRWELLARVPQAPVARLLWLPALGVAARHYLPLAEALAAQGIAVFLHEWRGHGSSNRRAGHDCDWGYRELLEFDLPASEAAMARAVPGTTPTALGGHSLGGQLACCRLALAPGVAGRLWLVASGAPYWRAFPAPTRWWLPLAYRFLPWLANRNGALPGRRIGFGGREARGLINDWAHSAVGGRYAARGLAVDLEAALARLQVDVRALVLSADWLAPRGSLEYLLGRMPRAAASIQVLDTSALGVRADHFQWMTHPAAVARALAADAGHPPAMASDT